ncbi:hypothetical protein ACJX0J_017434, partial [Zea mays]
DTGGFNAHTSLDATNNKLNTATGLLYNKLMHDDELKSSISKANFQKPIFG